MSWYLGASEYLESDKYPALEIFPLLDFSYSVLQKKSLKIERFHSLKSLREVFLEDFSDFPGIYQIEGSQRVVICQSIRFTGY